MPLSDCEVRDPRIRRTRQLLQGALQTLMGVKSFDEISVQDITEAATVNRATFYDHYTDKYALLEAMIGGGFHLLLHERNVTFDTACPEALGAIVLAVCDFLSINHSRGTCETHSAFQPLIDAAMAAAIRRILLQGMPSRSESALSVEVITTSASWALFAAVKQWCTLPDRPPAEEIVQPLTEMILPILAAAGPGTLSSC